MIGQQNRVVILHEGKDSFGESHCAWRFVGRDRGLTHDDFELAGMMRLGGGQACNRVGRGVGPGWQCTTAFACGATL